MPTLSAHAPSSTTTSSKHDGADFEPDEEWKRQLRKRIEEGLQSMVADAKESQAAELRRAVVSAEDRLRLEAEYKQAMHNIKSLANEQYQIELNREINQRRWTAGVPMRPGWTQILHEEQQLIMNSIKQSGAQSDNSARTVSESPTEDRRPVLPKPANGFPPTDPPRNGSDPPPPTTPQHREEREKSSVPPQSARRGSDARSTSSRDRDERPPSLRRTHHPAVRERPALPDNWAATDAPEETDAEAMIRPPPPRTKLTVDRLPPPPISPERWDSSLGRSSGSTRSVSDRHIARSPPKPEVWKPAIAAVDDAPPSTKHYNLGRRGSTASMKSTGSGASIRPSISETIPERSDDGAEEYSSIDDPDQQGSHDLHDHDRPRKPMDKVREKEKRHHNRKSNRPSPVDPSFRYDEPMGSSSLRSAGSTTMHYATSPSPNKPLSSKSSFVGDERFYPSDKPIKLPPSIDSRDHFIGPREHGYLHREQSFPPRDLPPSSATRPLGPRPSYEEDDSDYISPYPPTPIRPIGPKSPYPPERDYAPSHQPISRQPSFSHEDRRRDHHWERDRDPPWDGEREREWGERERDRGWDRDYDRDRERQREHIYPGYGREYPYPPSSRPVGYPTPPSSASRPPPQEYHHGHEFFDERQERDNGPTRSHSYRAPPDEWDYLRSESTRPIPTRRPSYSRRDDPDRRLPGDIDGYSRHYPHPPPASGGIAIPRHEPSIEDVPAPAWQAWAAEGGGRRRGESRYEYPHARSPPTADTLPHRRPSVRPTPSYDNSPQGDHPSFGGRETDAPSRDEIEEEYNSNDEVDGVQSGEDSEDKQEDEDQDEDEDDEEEEKDDEEDGEKDSEEDGENVWLDSKVNRLVEQRLAAQEDIKKRELEVQRVADEARRLEEETLRKELETRKKEEEMRLKEEEVRRKEEEAEERAKEAKRKVDEAKKKEKEAKRKADDAKRLEREAAKKAEEAKKKEEEIRRKEEETRQKEERLRQDTEKTKKMQLEAQKIAEDALKKEESLKKMEEEAQKKDVEIREREAALKRREEELLRREADNLRREKDAKRKAQEAKEKEEENERKEEAARKDMETRKREQKAQAAARRKEEARQRAEEARQRAEEARQREEEAVKQREEEAVKQREEEAVKQREEEEAAKQREEEEARQKEKEAAARREEEAVARRREEVAARRREATAARRQEDEVARRREEDARREERFRQEQEARRMLEEQHDEFLFDGHLDPKVIEEQARLLQQAQFRKREEDIKRTREERKRHDSVGNESAWTGVPYATAPAGTSPGMSRSPPQYPSASPSADRNGSAPTWSNPAPAWAPSMKPTASPSPTTNRSSGSIPTGKQRTASVSSGSFPATSSSPHAPPILSEAERTRKQQEFANIQHEQFRREQERLEADRLLRSAGRPLSREDLQRIFEQHEKLWKQLPSRKELTWADFAWPIPKVPLHPEDITSPLISAYIHSPFYPDKDKARSPKDRIKDLMKRWHPDRFETNLLHKVIPAEKEKVQQGAGDVARYLSDLLRKENENSSNNIFGD
ncbi:hypothetical protein B0H34DRAFT_859663 [Crassisporium funariophilum]|nr:hypothetical protein B0H34DRAFT_859663 [Crassisporium funariophilum]